MEGFKDNSGFNAVFGSSGGGSSSSGVQSVTGLDTDNTDPQNPVVNISVDGVTITGAGTPANPLVASGGSFSLNGTNYLSVLAQGTPSQNGTELSNAYATAKLMTPNGLPLSINNRVTIYIASGYFDMSEALFNQFIIDTSFIDFVSLSGQTDVYLSSIEVLSNALGIDVLINGIDTTINGYYPSKQFAVASSGGMRENIVIKNCRGGDFSFGAFSSSFRGLYDNCYGGDFSFCYIPPVPSIPYPSGMTITSFFTGNMIMRGYIRNCRAVGSSFVGTEFTTLALSPSARNYGTIENCVSSAENSFCYSSYEADNSGTINNCTAYGKCFAYGEYSATNNGTIKNCVSNGDYSFVVANENIDGFGTAINNGYITNSFSYGGYSFCVVDGLNTDSLSAQNGGLISNCEVYGTLGTYNYCFMYVVNGFGGWNFGNVINCNAINMSKAFCGELGLMQSYMENCIALSDAFSSGNPLGVGGQIYRCTLINGNWTTGTTGGGKVVLGIDLSGIVNF